MAREKKVRVNEDELERLKEVRSVMWPSHGDDIPLGMTVDRLCEHFEAAQKAEQFP